MTLETIRSLSRPAVQSLLKLGYTSHLTERNHWAVSRDGIGVTVYRITDRNKIERRGHYAAGKGFIAVVILSNNRVLLGNDKLHLLKLSE